MAVAVGVGVVVRKENKKMRKKSTITTTVTLNVGRHHLQQQNQDKNVKQPWQSQRCLVAIRPFPRCVAKSKNGQRGSSSVLFVEVGFPQKRLAT